MRYPLKIELCGGARYVLFSRGHHNAQAFMEQAFSDYQYCWPMRFYCRTYWKAVPHSGESEYHEVPKGVRGAFPVTVAQESSVQMQWRPPAPDDAPAVEDK